MTEILRNGVIAIALRKSVYLYIGVDMENGYDIYFSWNLFSEEFFV